MRRSGIALREHALYLLAGARPDDQDVAGQVVQIALLEAGAADERPASPANHSVLQFTTVPVAPGARRRCPFGSAPRQPFDRLRGRLGGRLRTGLTGAVVYLYTIDKNRSS
jgi:hypothetical protein